MNMTSTTIKMEAYSTVGDSDHHEIFIKTEVEDTEANYDDIEPVFDETLESSSRDIEDSLILKLEPEIKLEYDTEEELEIKIETFDENCNTDSKSVINIKESNQGIIEAAKTSKTKFESGINSAKQSKNIDKTQILYCDKCDYTTNVKNDFKNHQLKKHNEIKPFKCDECSYRTKTEYCLQRHLYVHTDERPFKCDECDYSAKNKSELKRHQRKHTEVNIFKCNKCEYTTKYQSDLTRHNKTLHLDHDNEKITYKCDLCDYVAILKTNLKKHQLKHKSNSEVEVFSCTKCNFVTKYKKSLTNHEITHTKPTIQCDQCDYKAKTLRYLQLHQLIHKDISEVENFKCTLCDYVTKRKRDLKDHLTKHNVNKYSEREM